MKRQQRLLGIVAIIICLTIAGRASGQFFEDGNDLYAKCTSSSPVAGSVCIGYVRGIIDAGEYEAGFASFQLGNKGPKERPDEKALAGFRWCPPKNVTSAQAVDVVTLFLRDNPDIRNGWAAALVAMAMQKAWPCSP